MVVVAVSTHEEKERKRMYWDFTVFFKYIYMNSNVIFANVFSNQNVT
jgi:hypothetical protein